MNYISRYLILTATCAIIVASGCSDQKPKEEAKSESPKPEKSLPSAALPPSPTPIATASPSPVTTPKILGQDTAEKREIMGLVADMQNGPDTISAVASEWVKYWNPAFDKPWTSTTPGQSLPQLLEALAKQQGPAFNQLLREKSEPWATDPQQKKSAVALASICAAAFSKATPENPYPAAELPDLFENRKSSLPVTVGDVLTYRIVDETSSFFEAMPKLPEGQLGSWIDLSRSQNPIYRLMALKLFGKFNATPEQAQSFYTSYQSESEPALNQALVDVLVGRSDPWASSLLPQVRAKLPVH